MDGNKTIFDLVNSEEIALYLKSAPTTRDPYLGEVLFPAKKRMGLDLSWFKGSKGLPVTLRPSSLDTKATLRDRKGFERVETEMPFFRESMRIGEKDRQDIIKVLNADNLQMIKPLLTEIFDDVGQLVESSHVSAEVMRMQLLSTGTISIHDNRTVYDYDYRMSDANKEKLVGGDAWGSPTAKPLEDIIRWRDDIEERTGHKPTRGIMTRKTFNTLIDNPIIKQMLYPGTDVDRVILTSSMLKSALEEYTEISFTIYNKRYTNEKGESTQFYPDGKVTLLPSNFLGNTWYGTTPEEIDLMSGNTDAMTRIVNTGIAITSIKEPHPVNVFNVVSGIFLPSFEQIDSVFIAEVF